MSRISEDKNENYEHNQNSNFNEYRNGLRELEKSGLASGYECKNNIINKT